MIVPVSHPAAVVRVPARGRLERVELASVTTQARIRTLPIGDLEPVEVAFTGPQAFSEVYRGGGALWRPIDPTTGITADRLLRWLADPSVKESVLEQAFAGTPLLGRADPLLPGWTGTALRGRTIDVEGSRSVSRDDRGRSAEAVAAYLDANVRIVGKHPFRRCEPLLRHTPGESGGPGRLEVAEGRGLGTLGTVVAAPGARAGLLAFLEGAGWPGEEDPAWDYLLSGHDALLAGADARLAANGLPSLVRRHLDRIAERDPDRALPPDLSRPLRALEVDALTGLAGRDDPEGAMRLLADVLEAGAGLGSVWSAAPLLHQLRAMRLHYLPGLAGPGIDPDDAEALRALL